MEIRPILSALSRNKIGALLMALQIALTLAIVTNAAFIIRERSAFIAMPSGLDEQNTIMAITTDFDSNIDSKQQIIDDLAHINGMPGVVAAIISHSIPVSGSGNGQTYQLAQETPSNEAVNFGNFSASIGNRANHLQSFIEQYARFARLPKPRIAQVAWPGFTDQLRRLVDFKLAEALPGETARFDAVQLEQVLINLIKNAAESGSAPEDIELRILQNRKEVLIAVEDRGSGMEAEQMQLALLPFYSTKRSGTGLGLPLCREIVEAHGGNFQLFNRERGGVVAMCRLPLE